MDCFKCFDREGWGVAAVVVVEVEEAYTVDPVVPRTAGTALGCFLVVDLFFPPLAVYFLLGLCCNAFSFFFMSDSHFPKAFKDCCISAAF